MLTKILFQISIAVALITIRGLAAPLNDPAVAHDPNSNECSSEDCKPQGCRFWSPDVKLCRMWADGYPRSEPHSGLKPLPGCEQMQDGCPDGFRPPVTKREVASENDKQQKPHSCFRYSCAPEGCREYNGRLKRCLKWAEGYPLEEGQENPHAVEPPKGCMFWSPSTQACVQWQKGYPKDPEMMAEREAAPELDADKQPPSDKCFPSKCKPSGCVSYNPKIGRCYRWREGVVQRQSRAANPPLSRSFPGLPTRGRQIGIEGMASPKMGRERKEWAALPL